MTATKFTHTHRPKHKDKLPWREIDGRTIIVHPVAGTVHELNVTGTLLWKNSDGHHSLDEMTDLLVHNFDLEQEVASEDVKTFFSELDSKGLIHWEENNV